MYKCYSKHEFKKLFKQNNGEVGKKLYIQRWRRQGSLPLLGTKVVGGGRASETTSPHPSSKIEKKSINELQWNFLFERKLLSIEVADCKSCLRN